MDMLIIDVSNIPEAKVGDSVTLIGRSGNLYVSINEIAYKIGVLPYEIMCGISERVVKKYINT